MPVDLERGGKGVVCARAKELVSLSERALDSMGWPNPRGQFDRSCLAGAKSRFSGEDLPACWNGEDWFAEWSGFQWKPGRMGSHGIVLEFEDSRGRINGLSFSDWFNLELRIEIASPRDVINDVWVLGTDGNKRRQRRQATRLKPDCQEWQVQVGPDWRAISVMAIDRERTIADITEAIPTAMIATETQSAPLAHHLGQLLEGGESDTTEFKSWMLTSERKNLKKRILRTSSAFANSSGGVLVLGVDDDGQLDGIEVSGDSHPMSIIPAELRQAAEDARQWIREEIEPSIVVSAHPLQHAGRWVVIFQVAPGSQIPVSAGDGTFYIRSGAKSVPCKHRDIVHLTLKGRGP